MIPQTSSEPLIDRILRILEITTLLVLVAGMVIVAFYESFWIFWGDLASSRHARLATVMRELNENWKPTLLILVPLFYRTVRTFLEQVEEAFGMKRSMPGGGGTATSPVRKK
jgi:hypothetical protein